MSAIQTVRTGGVSLCTLLTVAFVTLKLCKIIDWSWCWVLAPLWGPWALAKVFIIETPKLERCRKCAHYVDDATGCWLEDAPPDDCGNFLPEGGAL